MKRKVIVRCLVVTVLVSLFLVLTSPVYADDLAATPSNATVNPEKQWEAFQHGQSGNAAPVVSGINSIPEDYLIALQMGVVPSDEYACQVCQIAKQELAQHQNQVQQPALRFKTVAEWKAANCPCTTWTRQVVIGAS